MKTFAPHYESLPSPQRALVPQMRNVADLGFTLYGGTALALRLGHRDSVDFDFFSELRLDRSRIQGLPLLADARTIQDESQTLSVLVGPENSPVKLSFFGSLSIGRIGQPQWTRDEAFRVASIDDLFATKLKVLMLRVEVKDYRDVAALIRSGASLERGLAGAAALFGKQFTPSDSLKALTYFEDGDLHALSPAERMTLERAVSDLRELPRLEIASRSLSA